MGEKETESRGGALSLTTQNVNKTDAAGPAANCLFFDSCGPVDHHGHGRRTLGFIDSGRDEETLSVGRDVVGRSDARRAGDMALEQLAWAACIERGCGGFHLHGHHLSVRAEIEKLSAVAAPARAVAAVG